ASVRATAAEDAQVAFEVLLACSIHRRAPPSSLAEAKQYLLPRRSCLGSCVFILRDTAMATHADVVSCSPYPIIPSSDIWFGRCIAVQIQGRLSMRTSSFKPLSMCLSGTVLALASAVGFVSRAYADPTVIQSIPGGECHAFAPGD